MDEQPDQANAGLIGKCFVVFDERQAGVVQFQGIVRERLDDHRYLVQLFDFVMGDPSTLHVVSTEQMTARSLFSARAAGAYMFFEDDKQLRFWMNHQYNGPTNAGKSEPTPT